MAPELFLGKDYNESADVFSFGESDVTLDNTWLVGHLLDRNTSHRDRIVRNYWQN